MIYLITACINCAFAKKISFLIVCFIHIRVQQKYWKNYSVEDFSMDFNLPFVLWKFFHLVHIESFVILNSSAICYQVE